MIKVTILFLMLYTLTAKPCEPILRGPAGSYEPVDKLEIGTTVYM